MMPPPTAQEWFAGAAFLITIPYRIAVKNRSLKTSRSETLKRSLPLIAMGTFTSPQP
jgi:hypothetical protein